MGATQERFQQMIGERIKFARKEARMTQEQLSARLGFKDRQILANIEGGKRRLAADELVKLTEIFNRPMDFFTDASLLAGEGQFCWRAPYADALRLTLFEMKAGRWIGAYRRLAEDKGEVFSPLVPQLAITERSSYEEARSAGEALAKEWQLGEIPAVRLIETAEKKLPLLILWVDAPSGISGAACQLREFLTILINRREPDGRRNYDFAHELFHLLTWDRLPPQHMDQQDPESSRAKRIEQLANNFASALLMPEEGLKKRWENRSDQEIHDWLNATASDYCVTADALYWRLRALSWLTEGDAFEVKRERLTWNGHSPTEQMLPKLFSERFVRLLHWGIENGQASVRWTAKLLDCSIHEVKGLFEEHKMPVPFDL